MINRIILINKAKGLIEKYMQPSEYAEAIIKYFDGDPHALDNFSGIMLLNELRYEIVAAIAAQYFYYQSQNIKENSLLHDILDNCGLNRVLVTNEINKVEEQMRQWGLLDHRNSAITTKGKKKIITAVIILLMDHGIVSRKYNKSKVTLDEIAEYFAHRWNMTTPELSRRPDEKQIQDALKAVPYLNQKELKNPKRLKSKPTDENPDNDNLSPTLRPKP